MYSGILFFQYSDIIRKMKRCKQCEYNGVFDICRKDHKLEFEDGCRKCGQPYMFDVYWSNHINNEDKDCPDFEQHYFDDPSGS